MRTTTILLGLALCVGCIGAAFAGHPLLVAGSGAAGMTLLARAAAASVMGPE